MRWSDPAGTTSLGIALRLLVAFAWPVAILMAFLSLPDSPFWTRQAAAVGASAGALFDNMPPKLRWWVAQAVLLLFGLGLYLPGIVTVAPLHRSLWAAATFTVAYVLGVTALILGASLMAGGV